MTESEFIIIYVIGAIAIIIYGFFSEREDSYRELVFNVGIFWPICLPVLIPSFLVWKLTIWVNKDG